MSSLEQSTQPASSLTKLAVRKAGHAALTILVCVVIWAFTDPDGGSFWPGWVIFLATLDLLVHVGKAALGDAKEREKLEKKYGDAQ